MAKIKIHVDPTGHESKIEGVGFTGPGCLAVTRAFENVLQGGAGERELKEEFHLEPEVEQIDFAEQREAE